MDEACIFKFKYGNECNEKNACSQSSGTSRIQTIITASKAYGDGLHAKLEKLIAEKEDLIINYHKNCVSRYTSKSNLAKYQKNTLDAPPPKKLRHLSSTFEFKEHCLYCGEICDVNKDPKHPERWRHAYICRSTVSEHDKTPYKEYLLQKCKIHGDGWADEVRCRIEGSLSDLHAVEARYHKDCMSLFFSNRNRKYEQSQAASATQLEIDSGLKHLLKVMSSDKNRIWNSIELFQ